MSRRRPPRWALLLGFLGLLGLLGLRMLAPAPAGASPGTLYVTESGADSNDCSSWTSACTLSHALSVAVSGDQIWVAAGTYTPTTADTDPRTATFQLKSGVAVYGGFPAAGGDMAGRNPATNVTTLSGDLLGDDGANFANNGDNSYHVVTGSDTTATAVLDGFTVSGGNANGSYPHEYGGGMYNDSGSPTVTGVTFSGNSAYYRGGGMYNSSSSPTLTGVTFSGNYAVIYGGGMYNDSSSAPTLTDVTFENDSSGSAGGGMYNNSSSPTLDQVTFSSNTTGEFGGGMFNATSSPTLTDVLFTGNKASNTNSGFGGGGMYNSFSSSPTLDQVDFKGNTAGFAGGGMYNEYSSPTLTGVTFSDNSAVFGGGMRDDSSSPKLTDVAFSGNTAGYSGGGMFESYSSPTLTGVLFTGNNAASEGGGIASQFSTPTLASVTFSGNTADANGGGMANASGSPTLTNVTFSGNSVKYLYGGGMYNSSGSPTLTNVTFRGNATGLYGPGGGMYNSTSGNPIVTNSIFWGDIGGEIVNSQSTPIVSYSDVEGGYAGTGNINLDPLLGTLGSYGGSTQTLPLLPGSAAIDAGSSESCPATDQRGVFRPQGSGCDMGAFEAQPFTLSITGGDNQETPVNTAFPTALQVTVAGTGTDPVAGGMLTFTAPTTGASATLTGSPAAIGSDGTASVTATANGIGGSYQVTAAAAGANTVSFSLTNTTAAATQLAFTTNPQTLTAGVVSDVMTVQLQDASGSAVNAGSGGVTVDLSSNSTGGSFYADNVISLPATAITSITIPEGASSGSFKYADSAVGTPTITAAASGLTSATQQETVTAGPVHHFAFGAIGPQVATIPFSITITAQDAFNNTVPGFTGTVSLSPASGTIDPPTTGNFSAGVWTGNVTLDTAYDPQTITASDGTPTGISNSFTVTAPANYPPVAEPASASVTAGGSVAITLTATDRDSSKLTFSIVTMPAYGTVTDPGKVSCAKVQTGGYRCSTVVAYTAPKSGASSDSFTFKANDGTSDSRAATVAITINPFQEPQLHLVFTSDTFSARAGQMVKLTLQVQDESGKVVIFGQNLTITLSDNDAGGTFYGTDRVVLTPPSVTILAGNSKVSFYYANPTSGASPTISASTGLSNFTDASIQGTIR